MKTYFSYSEAVKAHGENCKMRILGPDKYEVFDSEGFAPWEEKEPVFTPAPVSAWQIRKALNASGLRAVVEKAVTDSGSQDLSDGWQYALEFERNNPLVLALGAALGKTPAELDDLWILAGSL